MCDHWNVAGFIAHITSSICHLYWYTFKEQITMPSGQFLLLKCSFILICSLITAFTLWRSGLALKIVTGFPCGEKAWACFNTSATQPWFLILLSWYHAVSQPYVFDQHHAERLTNTQIMLIRPGQIRGYKKVQQCRRVWLIYRELLVYMYFYKIL